MSINPRSVVEQARRNRGSPQPAEVRGDAVAAESVHSPDENEDEDDESTESE